MRNRVRLNAIVITGVLAMTACKDNEQIKQVERPAAPINITVARNPIDVVATINYNSTSKKCTQTATVATDSFPVLSVANKDTISWKGTIDNVAADGIIVEFPAVLGLTRLATIGTPLRTINSGEALPLNTLISDPATKATKPEQAVYTAITTPAGQNFNLSTVVVIQSGTGTAYPCATGTITGMQPFGVHVQQ